MYLQKIVSFIAGKYIIKINVAPTHEAKCLCGGGGDLCLFVLLYSTQCTMVAGKYGALGNSPTLL